MALISFYVATKDASSEIIWMSAADPQRPTSYAVCCKNEVIMRFLFAPDKTWRHKNADISRPPTKPNSFRKFSSILIRSHIYRVWKKKLQAFMKVIKQGKQPAGPVWKWLSYLLLVFPYSLSPFVVYSINSYWPSDWEASQYELAVSATAVLSTPAAHQVEKQAWHSHPKVTVEVVSQKL